MNGSPTLESMMLADGQANVGLRAAGAWTARHADGLEQLVQRAASRLNAQAAIDIDVSGISKLDTFGAWLLERLSRSLKEKGIEPRLTGLHADYQGLINEVNHVPAKAPAKTGGPGRIPLMLETVGRAVAEVGHTGAHLITMLGNVVAALGQSVTRPMSFRFTSMVHQLEQVGWRAIPIIVLITFLVGCIIAQQGIFHFRKFGADVFVVDMVGILVLRELGVLLVAIMVAGRSGSAYTAELGSMKMREEIDALRTMGFDPIEVLVLPRILALIIAVPLLTFIGSMAALYGGGLTAWIYGDIQPDIFLSRLREAISIDHFKVGMIKAPFMALIIGIIACVEGMNVRGSAESLGQHTTASVVKAIFFVIVLDGAFAVFFASIGM